MYRRALLSLGAVQCPYYIKRLHKIVVRVNSMNRKILFCSKRFGRPLTSTPLTADVFNGQPLRVLTIFVENKYTLCICTFQNTDTAL